MSKNNFSKAMKELIGISDNTKSSSEDSINRKLDDDFVKPITDFSDLAMVEEEEEAPASIEEQGTPAVEVTGVNTTYSSSRESDFDREREEAAAKLRAMLIKDREKEKDKTNTFTPFSKPMETAVAADPLQESSYKTSSQAPTNTVSTYASSNSTSTPSASTPIKEIPSIKPLDKSIPPEEAKTVIGKGVVIMGNIITQGDLEVKGTVKGDLKTSGNLHLSGKIAGDVGVENLDVVDGAIQGDVLVRGRANIGKDAVVLGDVTAGNLNLQGKVKGNIAVRDVADLGGTAIIDGNVSAASVAIDPGTKLRGQISLTTASDVNDDEFAIDFD